MDSKKLSNKDESGDRFSDELFSDNRYKEFSIDFDRLSFNYKENSWVVIEHILTNDIVTHVDDLNTEDRNKINRILNFTEHLKNTSGKDVTVFIDLYFGISSQHKDKILLLDEDKNFHEVKMDEYALFFREINYYGNQNNKDKTYLGQHIKTADINGLRSDDSAFAVSKACLANEVTYGFNLDKLIYNDKTKEVYLFELLLCDEAQSVTPWTSHPNKYFRKNAMKFINLVKVADELKTSLYLINYAKPQTKAEKEILFMKVLSLNVNNSTTPLLTEDKKITFESLQKGLSNKILKNNNPSVKIGNKKFNNS
jgi:hypothetical protein